VVESNFSAEVIVVDADFSFNAPTALAAIPTSAIATASRVRGSRLIGRPYFFLQYA
jgi:hypothetical protein